VADDLRSQTHVVRHVWRRRTDGRVGQGRDGVASAAVAFKSNNNNKHAHAQIHVTSRSLCRRGNMQINASARVHIIYHDRRCCMWYVFTPSSSSINDKYINNNNCSSLGQPRTPSRILFPVVIIVFIMRHTCAAAATLRRTDDDKTLSAL